MFDLKQFLAAVNILRDRILDQSEIIKSLKVFEKDGYINIDQFKQEMMKIGDILSASEVIINI